jgi:hypothetical protein
MKKKSSRTSRTSEIYGCCCRYREATGKYDLFHTVKANNAIAA